MLSYVFLGSQDHVFLTEGIKDPHYVAVPAYFQIRRWKIQAGEAAVCVVLVILQIWILCFALLFHNSVLA